MPANSTKNIPAAESRLHLRKSRQRDLWLQTILLHNPHKGAEIDGLMDDSIRFNIVLKPAASYDHYGNRLHPSVTLLPREEFPATHYRHHQIEDDVPGERQIEGRERSPQ